jgi:hypothetical protein
LAFALMMLSTPPAVMTAADPPASVPQADCRDVASLMQSARAAIEESAVDVRIRLTGSRAGRRTDPLQLRIRAKKVGPAFRTLIEVTAPPDRRGAALLTSTATGVEVESRPPLRAAPLAPPDDLDAPGALPWLSPCLLLEDYVDAHYWWTTHAAQGAAKVGDRMSCVVRSEPGDIRRTDYRSVKTWLDPERLVPLKAEKVVRADGSLTQLVYSGFRQRDRRWGARRKVITSASTGCRSEFEILGGSVGARLADSVFTLGPAGPRRE